MSKVIIKKIPSLPKSSDGILQNLSLTSDLKILSYISDDKLTVYSLVRDCYYILDLENIQRYIWQQNCYSDGNYQIMVITDNNSINLYELCTQIVKDHHDSDFVLTNEWNSSILKQIVTPCEINKVEVLSFCGQRILLLLNDEMVVSLILTSGHIPVHQLSLKISDPGDIILQYQLYNDMLFVLKKGRNVLSLYSMTTGQKESEWNLHSICDDCNVPDVKFFVKPDFKTLVICNNKLQIFQYQLNQLMKTELKKSQKNIITAFAKKIPSLTKVAEGIRTGVNKFEQISFNQLNVSSDMKENVSIEEIMILEDKIFIYCRSTMNQNSFLVVMEQSGSVIACERFNEGIYIIKEIGIIPSPFLFLYNNDICSLLINTTSERIVSELMVYFSGTVAEKISHLNNWQDINVKSEVLEQGLKNHQLDIIAFFLRTHEEGFHQICLTKQEQMNEWTIQINLQLQFWDSVITKLLNTVKESLCDTSSCQFAEQLLQLTVCTLTNLLWIINTENMKEDENLFYNEDIVKAGVQLAKYFKIARLLMHGQSLQDEKESLVESNSLTYRFAESDDPHLHEQWANWNEITFLEIIQDGIKQRNLLSVQGYLSDHYQDEYQLSQTNLWKSIHQIGISMAKDYLVKENFEAAIQIFSNMGLSSDETLVDIFKSTSDSQLRNVLLVELERRQLLTEKDNENVQFINEVETIYSYKSSEESKNHLTSGSLVFNWVTSWDENVRSRIILAGINDWNSSRLISISPQLCWEYLLEYGNLPVLESWITGVFNKRDKESDTFRCDWTINDAMINNVKSLAPKHIQEAVLDRIARAGIFCEEELEEFPLLLRRLGRIQFNWRDKSLFQSTNSSISVSDFSHRIIHYCLNNDLFNFLYHFLTDNMYSLQSFPRCRYCCTPLLGMISAFSNWSKKPNDSALAFQAILNTAQYIYKMPEASIQALWKHAPPHVTMAAVLFAPMQLSQIANSIRKGLMGVDIESVKTSLSSLPLLRDALFKTDNGDSRMKLDVSVYQLLQDNAPFDPTRLFRWQTTNNIKNEDTLTELPHFSQSELVEKYGYKKKLTFHYYLLNGRPSCAYMMFVIHELTVSETITSRRISAACQEATLLAIKHYNEEKIIAACVIFVEMLGQDSVKLRIYIQVAFIIHKARNFDKNGTDLELAMLLEFSLENKNSAMEIVLLLESAVQKEISSLGEKNNAATEMMWWLPVMSFCHIHKLDPVTTYMKKCAKNDDWLRFLIFAQLFQIPLIQVLKLLSEFSNPYLIDHLSNAFQRKHVAQSVSVNKTSSLNRKMKMQQRDDKFRETLYSRIGVSKTPKIPNSRSAPEISSDDEVSSVCSEESSAETVPLCGDLWGQILLCHNTVCPWKSLLQASYAHHNPILAVIAASYQDASIPHCFVTWLYTSMDKTAADEDSTVQISSNLEEAIIEAMKHKRILLLQRGFLLFLPNSTLLLVINFLVSFIVHKQYETSIELLKQFLRHLWKITEQPPDSEDQTYFLNDLKWIQTMCVDILSVSIECCETIYEKRLILQHFFFSRIQNMFSLVENVPDFNKLYQLLQYIAEFNIRICVQDLLQPEKSDKYKQTCIYVIQKLQDSQHNNEAYSFAKVAKFPLHEVLLSQVINETQKQKTSHDWNDIRKRFQFWQKCNSIFKREDMKVNTPAYFFKEESDKSDSYIEKFFLVKLAISWILVADAFPENIRKLLKEWEVNMWLYCIKAEVEIKRLDLQNIVSLEIERDFKDSDILIADIDDISFNPIKLDDEEELIALEKIIDKLLNIGNLKQAQKVSNIFDCKSKDVDIIITCTKLAKETILLEDIDPEIKKLISFSEKVIPFSRFKFSEKSQQSYINLYQKEVISSIKKLGEISKGATSACEKILTYYRVAKMVKISYDDARSQDASFSLIKMILTCPYPERYILAKEILTVNSVTEDEIVEFLSQEIMICLKVYTGTAEFSLIRSSTELIFNPSNTSETFQQLLCLCENPSTLGAKLLNFIDNEIEKKETEWIKSNLYLTVELYIRCHDCFTAASNMEGISKILHQARNMTRILTDAEEFPLLVRLLTGIGRYSEMAYIFDVLRETHQFELLFRKGMEKVPHLRLALLHYLKHCRGIDSDVYSMLALNFSMYREIAEILETSAKESLIKIRKRNIGDAKIKENLLTAMHEFADAAESYCKADCLSHAERCALQAKLVALQIHLLQAGIWIIGLDNKAVAKFIAEHDKFAEAYIVSEAYNHHQTWSHAIYRQIIERGDWNYFSEFEAAIGLNAGLIEDISRMLLLYTPKFEHQMCNLKKLLQKCDIEVRFKIATEFGLKDVINGLLENDSGPFVKDLMRRYQKRQIL